MSTAEKIGLLPGFGWIAGHDLWLTLVLCWLLTPIGHYVVGAVFEYRLVPLSPTKQFLSFFPGDVFLGMMTAGLLVAAQQLPGEKHWYNSAWWNIVVLLGAIVVACVLTWLEYEEGAYPSRAMVSPTKLYHNFILYGGYGYIIVTTLVAVLYSARSWWLALILLPGLVWLSLLVFEGTQSDEIKRSRIRNAHIADWYPIWRRP